METETRNCCVCNAPFTPTKENHLFCKNLCRVKVYQSKQKIKAMLKRLRNSSELKKVELLLKALTEINTNEELKHER